MGDFQAKSQTFLAWFRSQPGATFHSAIELSDLRERNAGRGVIAVTDIPAETDLFTIPRRSVLSVDSSVLSKKLPEIFTTIQKEDENGESRDFKQLDSQRKVELVRDPWFDLILVTIYEYLQGQASPWKPYFDVLPDTDEFDTLMFWTDHELSLIHI